MGPSPQGTASPRAELPDPPDHAQASKLSVPPSPSPPTLRSKRQSLTGQGQTFLWKRCFNKGKRKVWRGSGSCLSPFLSIYLLL